jgi:hypothetical protein
MNTVPQISSGSSNNHIYDDPLHASTNTYRIAVGVEPPIGGPAWRLSQPRGHVKTPSWQDVLTRTRTMRYPVATTCGRTSMHGRDKGWGAEQNLLVYASLITVCYCRLLAIHIMKLRTRCEPPGTCRIKRICVPWKRTRVENKNQHSTCGSILTI